MVSLNEWTRTQLLTYQKNEITEYHIYHRLAERVNSSENRQILQAIAEDEHRHYEQWKVYTQQDVEPDPWKIRWFTLISRIFGFTFGVKLMERGEEGAQDNYAQLQDVIDEAKAIAHDESVHENALLELLDEERLRYTGSIVLGLSDALVELTGEHLLGLR